YSIPYFSIAAEISDDPQVRTRIVAYRIAFMATGLIVSSLAPLLVAYGGDGPAGYSFMSFVFAAVCAATMLTPFWVLAKTPLKQATAQTPGLREQIRLAVQNKPFLWLVSANFLQRVAEGAGYATLAYFIIYRLELGLDKLAPLLLVMSGTAIAAQPLWVRVAARLGKVRVYWLTLPAYCFVFALWAFAPPQTMGWVYVIGFLNGLFNSGFLLMAQAMLTDTIEWDARKTGLERAGAYSGLWLANEKVAFTVGAMITASILGAFGFVSGTEGAGVVQSQSAINGVVVAFVVTPVVFHMSSLLLLRNYKLSEADLAAARSANPAD
ncbi:MAG: MFS transporter, partial [Pseudomonadota bacterium]